MNLSADAPAYEKYDVQVDVDGKPGATLTAAPEDGDPDEESARKLGKSRRD